MFALHLPYLKRQKVMQKIIDICGVFGRIFLCREAFHLSVNQFNQLYNFKDKSDFLRIEIVAGSSYRS